LPQNTYLQETIGGPLPAITFFISLILQKTVLRVTLLKDAKSPAAYAEIVKLVIPQPTIGDITLWSTEKSLVAAPENSLTLLNLLYVPESSFLSRLVDYFVRLESILFSFFLYSLLQKQCTS
jgi:hypothetical protein